MPTVTQDDPEAIIYEPEGKFSSSTKDIWKGRLSVEVPCDKKVISAMKRSDGPKIHCSSFPSIPSFCVHKKCEIPLRRASNQCLSRPSDFDLY